MPTISEVANNAGVSIATVSYVMNDRPFVGKDVRQKVLQIASKMNYVPRRRSHLRDKKQQQVKSLAFLSCLPFDPWGEPYWGQFLSGCVDISHDTDCMLQVARLDPNEPLTIENIPVVIRNRMVDGLIVAGWPSRIMMDSLAATNIPLVLLDTKDIFDGFTHVRPDYSGGIAKSVDYLHSLGHERIGVLAWEMGFTCELERNSAYIMAMSRAGLPINENWIVRQPKPWDSSGYEGMKELLSRKAGITAVICHGDRIAHGAILAAQEAGLKVPDDISIIGGDNQSFASQLTPSLTTIDVSLIEMGRVAVENLLRIIANPNAKPQRVTIEASIIERESTAAIK